MFTASRTALRQLLAGDGCIAPTSVFDPISARIAEQLGYPCLMLAGSTASLAILGAPDIVAITLTEFADLATRITRASRVPLLVDADAGYGNAANAMRTAIELCRAGVSGMTLEDTDLPTPHGATAPRLISRAEGEAKLRAALHARPDPDMVIVGRTSAVSIDGLDEAIARVALYDAAGADALFFNGVDTVEQLQALRAATRLPFILGGTKLTDRSVLAAHGVRIALRGHQPIMAAIAAVEATMLALRDGTPLPPLASAALLQRTTSGFEPPQNG